MDRKYVNGLSKSMTFYSDEADGDNIERDLTKQRTGKLNNGVCLKVKYNMCDLV